MHENLRSTLARADELLAELIREYDASLRQQNVSARAMSLTHEVLERLRSALDRTAHLYFIKRIAPTLSEAEVRAAKVYFPVTATPQAFEAKMGLWRWKAVKHDHQALCTFLVSKQPYSEPGNAWLGQMAELVNAGKHVDLAPQKRIEQRLITVTSGGASVSWNPGAVRFGGSVHVAGAPIDPLTQRIVPTPGVAERVEIWVGFTIEKYGVDAVQFCRTAVVQTRAIISDMHARFGL